MQKQPLTELLNELEQELVRLGYTEGSMKFYRRRWRMLLQFARRKERYTFPNGWELNLSKPIFTFSKKILNGPFCRERHKNFELSG